MHFSYLALYQEPSTLPALQEVEPPICGAFLSSPGVNEMTYRLQLPSDYRISPSFHVSLLRPVVPRPMAEVVPQNTPPPPLDVEGGPAFDVRSLLYS